MGVDGSANQILTDDGDGTVSSESKWTIDGDKLGTTTAATTGTCLDIDASSLTTGHGLKITDNTYERAAGHIKLSITDTYVDTINRGSFGIISLSYTRPSANNVNVGQAVESIGSSIRMDDDASNHAGDATMIGQTIHLDYANAGAGNTFATGLQTRVGGGDTNVDIKMINDADDSEYTTIAIGAGGATEIATNSDDATGHLSLTSDGNLNLSSVYSAAGTGTIFKNDGTTIADLTVHHAATWLTIYENGGASTDDYFTIKTAAKGATDLITWDAGGSQEAHFTLDIEGNINLDANGGQINFKDNGVQLAKIDTNGLSFQDNTGARITWEGATDNAHQTTLSVIDPTDSRTIDLPNASGTVQLQGTGAGKQLQVFICNFYDDLSTAKHYIPFKDINEQTAIYQDEVAMQAVCDGRIVSISVSAHSLTSSGNLTVGVHTRDVNESMLVSASSWTDQETETLAVTGTDDNHTFHFAFSNAKHFDSTQKVSLSIQADSDLGGFSFWYTTVVVEWDWTTFLGSTSAEIDSTP